MRRIRLQQIWVEKGPKKISQQMKNNSNQKKLPTNFLRKESANLLTKVYPQLLDFICKTFGFDQ